MDLITGGTGIVGSHLLLELLVRGGDVRATHRPRSDRDVVRRIFRHYDREALFDRVHWIECDVLDVHGLAEAMTGVEHVHHCAALVSFDPRDTKRLSAINITGASNVVNAALEAGVKRLCHVSSTGAIGRGASNGVLTEDQPWQSDRRTSPYAISKYEAELQVRRGVAEGLDAVIVNPCIVIGPGPVGRSSMTLIERLRRGTRFFPSGANAVVDARDVAHAMVDLMERGATGERYLLIGENISYRDLFAAVAGAFGMPAPDVPARPWMLGTAWRAERMRSLLTGSRALITHHTVNTSRKHQAFSAEKVTALLGMKFRGVEEMAGNVAAFLMGR